MKTKTLIPTLALLSLALVAALPGSQASAAPCNPSNPGYTHCEATIRYCTVQADYGSYEGYASAYGEARCRVGLMTCKYWATTETLPPADGYCAF